MLIVSTKKLIKSIVILIYKLCTLLLPINKNIILFESNLGRNYSDNPKYIYEELFKLGLDRKYKCIWILEDTSIRIPGNCKKIKRHRIKYFYYLSVSKFWIFNCRQPGFLIKRDKCVYIQTWHGTPLKKLGLDMNVLNMAGENDLDNYKANFYKNTRRWDYLVSQNVYSSEIFKSAFAFNKEILEIGYPRNDILINKNNEYEIENIKNRLGLPLDKKIVLYAPTWRDDEYYDKAKYKFNIKLDLEYLKRELGNEYIFILKMHYLIMDNLNLDEYKGFAYVYSPQQDIQELYLVSDILVTDYSSVMFDYSLLNRPMIYFTYDLDKYKKNIRGFYFNLEEHVPGPVIKTNEELIKAIKSHSIECYNYQELYTRFKNKFNHIDDGQASIKIINLIEKLYEKR